MILALHGPLQCGKSTLASLLLKAIPGSQLSSFSNCLREEIVDEKTQERAADILMSEVESMPPLAWAGWEYLNELPGAEARMEWLSDRPADPRSRALQQWWGQDFRRPQDPDYWIKKHFQKYCSLLLQGTLLIEESCRQPNERDYVHMLGGLVIDLAPLAPPTGSEAEAMKHSVEQIALSWKGDIEVNMQEYFDMPSPLYKQQWLGWLIADLRGFTSARSKLGVSARLGMAAYQIATANGGK